MGIEGWLTQNWFDLLSAVGIVASLLFTAVSLHSETKTRRVANLLALTQNHRELWRGFYQNADLTRVWDSLADTQVNPPTLAEQEFVNVVIHHLSSVYRATRYDLTVKPEGMARDVRAFFSLPIPKDVWERMKSFHDADFVTFVENCLK